MINIKRFVKHAINEDNGRGDLFYDIAPEGKFTAKIISKNAQNQEMKMKKGFKAAQ